MLLNPGEVHAPKPATDNGWGFRMIYFEMGFFQGHREDFGPEAPQFVKPFVQDDARDEPVTTSSQIGEKRRYP